MKVYDGVDIFFKVIAGALVIALGVYAFFALYNPPMVEEEYPLSTVVCGVDIDNDIVGLEDFNGNVWEINGVEDFMEGDVVALIMSDNGTPRMIEDDIVISARYCGWVY